MAAATHGPLSNGSSSYSATTVVSVLYPNSTAAISRELKRDMFKILREQDIDQQLAFDIVHRFVKFEQTHEDKKMLKMACEGVEENPYKDFKRRLKRLQMLEEAQDFTADIAEDKRVSVQVQHRDAAYYAAVEEHKKRCHQNGGFRAGSQLHSLPVADEFVFDESNYDRGIKRARRHNAEAK